MDWNEPWVAYRVYGVVIFLFFLLVWAEAKFKEEDPRKKRKEEEERKKAEESKRKQYRRFH